jgi:hypothetical protein
MNYAAATGDVGQAASIATNDCDSCREMLRKISTVYDAGGEFRGDGWQVLRIRYQPFQPMKRPVLSVAIRVSRQVMVSRAGGAPETFEGGRHQLNLHLIGDGDSWRVRDMERLS